MPFFQLFRREMQGSPSRLVLASCVAALSIMAMLASINIGVQGAASGKVSFWALGLFLIAVILFTKAQNFLLATMTVEIETITDRLRVRLIDQLRRCELFPLQRLGRS